MDSGFLSPLWARPKLPMRNRNPAHRSACHVQSSSQTWYGCLLHQKAEIGWFLRSARLQLGRVNIQLEANDGFALPMKLMVVCNETLKLFLP
jgi:hypothetical protein